MGWLRNVEHVKSRKAGPNTAIQAKPFTVGGTNLVFLSAENAMKIRHIAVRRPMIVRLPPPILRTRALSSGRRPYWCLEFYGVGSQLVCSARSRTTLPIGSGVRETHSQIR